MEISKTSMGVQSSATDDDGEIQGASEVMNLAAAAALFVCQSALVKSPAASYAALNKHQASISPELAAALKVVGSYTNASLQVVASPM